MTAADIGASTGGFTQCLLDGGAVRVFAVDSGHGQLSPVLLGDGRVVSVEGFNARYLTADTIGCRCDIAVMDVSFISQRLLYAAVSSVLKDDGILISLIKPQFEVGREHIKKGGIVRDKDSHVRAVMSLFSESVLYGLYPHELMKSPVKGGDGNTEYLALFRKKPGDIRKKRRYLICKGSCIWSLRISPSFRMSRKILTENARSRLSDILKPVAAA